MTPLVSLTAAALAVPLVIDPVLTLAGIATMTLMAAVILHPPLAAYLLAGTTVLVAGMGRGSLLPVIRPSEGVLLILSIALLLRALIRRVNGAPPTFAFTRVDGALVVFALSGSVLPLLWMMFRGEPVTLDDALFALALWKVYAVVIVIRTSVQTETHVMRCLWLSMSAAVIVAVIAVLQTLDLFGVREAVLTYYPPSEQVGLDPNRGSSTLGASLVTANVMTFSLAIALACLTVLRRHRLVLTGAVATFVFGGIASGQFSAVIGLAVVAVVIGLVKGQLTKTLLGLVGSGLVAGLFLQSIVDQRLSSFRAGGRLPSSWIARLDNLRTYFWPELFSDFNYVFGIRPAPRVPYPGPGDVYVWIESGYTWLLWAGGLPMLVMYTFFMWATMTTLLRIARSRADAIGAAGTGAFAAFSAVAVLMTFDPQLTGRGEGELLFMLLALALAAVKRNDSEQVQLSSVTGDEITIKAPSS